MIYDGRRGKKLCVHYSRYETKTDIRKEMGSLSLSFFMFFLNSVSGTRTHTRKKDRRRRPARKYEAASTGNRRERQRRKMDIEICARREVFISFFCFFLCQLGDVYVKKSSATSIKNKTEGERARARAREDAKRRERRIYPHSGMLEMNSS